MPYSYARKVYSRRNPMYRKGAKMSRRYNRYVVKPAYRMGVTALKSYLGLNTERKFHDITPTPFLPTTTAVITPLTQIPAGIGGSQRIGDKVRCMSGYTKWTATFNASGSNTQILRVMLVRALTASQVALEVLDGSAPGGLINAPRNLGFSTKYKVLFDRKMILSPGGSEQKLSEKFVKMNNVISFLPSTATEERNSLFLLTMSNEPTNAPTLSVFFRLRYVDN